jgi:DNA polymerase epsilon subunit 1
MRENPFYVDTVRSFRDRRYDFKRLVKVWVAKFKDAQGEGDLEKIELAKNRMGLYESL